MTTWHDPFAALEARLKVIETVLIAEGIIEDPNKPPEPPPGAAAAAQPKTPPSSSRSGD